MTTKTCSMCGRGKPLDAFNRRSTTRDRLRNECRSCQSAYNARRYALDPERFKRDAREYETTHRTQVLERKREYYEGNKKQLNERYAAHCQTPSVKARRSQYRKGYATLNRAKERHWSRTYAKRYPSRNAARTAARNAAKLRATPAWADLSAIRLIYEIAATLTASTGEPWHVDHVVPLRHPLVCGLHTHQNLQPLRATDNIAKSNRFWPDCP